MYFMSVRGYFLVALRVMCSGDIVSVVEEVKGEGGAILGFVQGNFSFPRVRGILVYTNKQSQCVSIPPPPLTLLL